LAILCINSCINTVFPTPAQPNNPTFHPLRIGAIRSTTFIPVSNTSAWLVSSSKDGADLCIARFSLAHPKSLSSIASHKTLNIRPRVSGHTGTVIGAHVLTTSSPLLSPSVDAIAIPLTTPSSSCCKTSITTSIPSLFLLVVFTACRILGGSLSNAISITIPLIAVITHLFSVCFVMVIPSKLNAKKTFPKALRFWRKEIFCILIIICIVFANRFLTK